VVAIGHPTTRANYTSISTNGNQGVSRAKDQVRTLISFVVDQIAAVVTKGMFTMTVDDGGTTSSASNWSVPASKVFRIQAIDRTVKLTGTTMNNSRAYLLGMSTGTVASTSPIIDCLLASPPVAATNATGCEGGDIPDALEIPAGWDSGLVHVEKATTCSVSLSRSDFIYSGQ
jgi:hypothetical protein